MRCSLLPAGVARPAIRRLLAAPGYSITTVLTLGIGVAAVSFVSAIAYGVLLRPLPYPHGGEVVSLGTIDAAGRSGGVSLADVADWREQSTSFQTIGAFIEQRAAIETPAGTRPVQIGVVGREFFDVLGLPAVAGRLMTTADEHAPTAVLAWSAWQQLFAASPSAVGARIRINGETATIIGIAPPDLTLPSGDVAAWIPLEYARQSAPPQWNMRGFRGFQGIGRLKTHAGVPSAAADLREIATRLAAQYPRFNRGVRPTVDPLSATRAAPVRQVLVLLWLSALVLLSITCGNAASLSLTRAIGRRQEWAIRRALGANGRQIAAEPLTEVILLGAAGTAAGLLIGSALVRVFEIHHPERFPGLEAVRMDVPVILATAVLGLSAAAAAALIPAWRALRSDAGETLKETRAVGIKPRRLHRWLASAQTALSVTLVLTTALLGRQLWTELSADLGTSTAAVLTARIDLTAPRYEKPDARRRFTVRLLERLAADAGPPAGFISSLPPATGQMRTTLAPEGAPDSEVLVDIVSNTPGAFDVLGMHILAGRGFDEADSAGSPPVAVLSATAARLLFPGRNAVGLRVPFGAAEAQPRVIGIVGDVRFRGLDAPAAAAMYLPVAQRSFRTMYVVLEPGAGYEAAARRLVRAVKEVDPDVALGSTETIEALRRSAASAEAFKVTAIGTITGSALFLALLGVYGVASQSVALRRKEFAVRVALGSSRVRIARLVLAETTRVCSIGAAAGMMLADLAHRSGRAHFEDIPRLDAASVAIAMIAALVIAVAAASIPAVGAATGRPSDVLRS